MIHKRIQEPAYKPVLTSSEQTATTTCIPDENHSQLDIIAKLSRVELLAIARTILSYNTLPSSLIKALVFSFRNETRSII